MKPYFIQKSELNIAIERLHTLEQEKQMYLRKATNTVSVIKDIVVVGGRPSDKMSEYAIKCEKIDKEIAELKETIAILEKGLKAMDQYLDSIKDKADTETKVFIYYFKEGKKAEEITKLVPCGIATVYRKIRKIEKLLKNDNK